MDSTFETAHLRLVISQDARVTQFVDKKFGKNYAAGEPFARVRKAGVEHAASSAVANGDKVTVGFGESGVSAVIGVRREKHYMVLEVLSVTGVSIDEFAFCDIRLKIDKHKAPFAACALALNLRTNVRELPWATDHLQAICYPRFGLAGAKVAIIGCPAAELRGVMKEVVSAAPDLPHSPIGGPWALDSRSNRASYLFNFGGMTEGNVDEWIKLAKSLGITQIDFHGGSSFRFGDCVPNPEWYPNGRASFRAVIDKLHAAGILAGLHTYAFFMDKHSRWVTPVPDRRLGSDASFTLAQAVSETEADLAVNESTQSMSATTGFFVRNSVLLRVDDEIVSYSGVSKAQPYGFTGCQRGVFGTKAAAHEPGAKAYHLTECFGYLAPDPESTLFAEVAQASADFYNECGFDMIYLDALDGQDILGGAGNGWHYGSAYVFELAKRLKKPALMEMSVFQHHLWYVRSRMGAWDTPARSYKSFIDLHCKSNDNCADMFLPAHLGWWINHAGGDPYAETTFADDIEYLMAKCAGYDCGIAPQGFTPESFAASYNQRRLGGIMKRWEDLRNAGFFTENMRAKLRQPGREFTLVTEDGEARVREATCVRHKVEGLDSPSSRWSVASRFEAQPAKLRIEALMSAQSYDSPDAATLMDFGAAAYDRESASDVTMAIEPSKDQVKAAEVSGRLRALWQTRQNSAATKSESFSATDHAQRKLAGGVQCWAKVGTVFSPEKDLRGKGALGVWVHGDGQREVLNFQLRSPVHLSTGIWDHYVIVDFTGWRYFELIEPEGERVDDYAWPYTGNSYAIYREPVHLECVESLSIWCNNLPAGKSIECFISPVKAIPLVKAKLVNPSVTIGGKTITFPVDLESGSYIEYSSARDCKLYAPDGAPVRDIAPTGDAPELAKGDNTVEFGCEPLSGGLSARANVTVTGVGEGL